MMNELYVDIFFIINFTINYIVLFLVDVLLKKHVKQTRICMSSIIVTVLSILFLKFPWKNHIIILLIYYLLLTTIHILLGLKVKKRSEFVKAYICMMFTSVCLGGMLYAIRSHLFISGFFFFSLIVAYFITYLIFQFLYLLTKENVNIFNVKLYIGGEEICVTGLYDTGNELCDVLTGAPICIVSKYVSDVIIRNSTHVIRKIPYRTITGESEIPITFIQKMCILKGGENICIMNPCIGLLDTTFSQDGKYEIILNSKII